MTLQIQGNAGVKFKITESDDALVTGNIIQVHEADATVADVSLASTDKVFSLSGTIGVTPVTINLNSLNNQVGGDFSVQVVRNNNGDLATVKSLVFNNRHATQTLTVSASAGNSYYPASEQRTIQPNSAIQDVNATAVTVGVNGNIDLVASAIGTTFEALIVGA